MLLEAQADLNMKNKDRQTPLDLAISKDHREVRWYLLTAEKSVRGNISRSDSLSFYNQLKRQHIVHQVRIS